MRSHAPLAETYSEEQSLRLEGQRNNPDLDIGEEYEEDLDAGSASGEDCKLFSIPIDPNIEFNVESDFDEDMKEEDDEE